MLCSFNQIKEMVSLKQPKNMAVVFPHDDQVIEAVIKTAEQGTIHPILIGNESIIKKLIHYHDFEIIDERDETKACQIAVRLVKEGKSDLLMKGLIDTKTILKAVVDKTTGITETHLLSHVGILEYPDFNRLLMITDGAMNIKPTIIDKMAIIENAVNLAHKLQIVKPKVGLVSAVEKVNPKMQSTVDAKELVDYYRDKKINFDIDGPFAIDNLVSEEASQHKGIISLVAGHADILVFPAIESANVFYKTSVFLAHADSAGIVLGAKVPIIVTSRADSMKAKVNSIYLGAAISYE